MRRSSEIAGFLLGALVLIAPVVLSIIDHDKYNLAALAIGPLALYWTLGSTLLIAPLLALTTLPGTWFERHTTATRSSVRSWV